MPEDDENDLSATIRTAATSPQAVKSDEAEVTARPISEIIKAEQYLQMKQAMTKAHFGLRLGKLVPPSSV